jgi:high-affinity Fe2+/Pb2+ permease
MIHPPRPPSIDHGVVAFIWAVVLGVFIYFGLIAIGESRAISIVLALVAFAGIWLLVRLRGEDVPPGR